MKAKKKLIVGRFYMAYGGHKHPAHIYAFDAKHKTYISIKFGTTQGKHMTEIHSIQIGVPRSFVHNRPFEGTRKDYGDKELMGLSIDNRDIEIIEYVKNQRPNKSKRAKQRYIKKKSR